MAAILNLSTKMAFAMGGFWWVFLSGYMVPQRACVKLNGFDNIVFQPESCIDRTIRYSLLI